MLRRYVTVDVFTEQRFAGNPLAVVLDAAGLSSAQMQAIAAEFNYSEITFVLPPRDPANTAWVRIFNPRDEMPFAGHPNVGTAFVLAAEALAKGNAVPDTMVFEEAAGLVPVTLLRDGPRVAGAELRAPAPLTLHSRPDPAAAAACLGLDASELAAAPVIASVGLPLLFVELASRDALRRAAADHAAFAALLPRDGASGLYTFTRDVAAGGVDIEARMFSPLEGMGEDPATGSATAALAALLAHAKGTKSLSLRVSQGVDMGRPSLLLARADIAADGAVTARVGGRCIGVMEGTLRT